MDLIEVLWKQDVDLGVPLAEPATTPTKKSQSEKEAADEIEKLKALEAINATNQKVRKKKFISFPINISRLNSPDSFIIRNHKVITNSLFRSPNRG